MNKTTMIIGGVVLIAGVLYFGNILTPQDTGSQVTVESTTDVAPTEEVSDTEVSETASWFTAYSSEALASAVQDGKKPVIFFHAGWCPTCKQASEDFEANASQIPSDVVILKADFDTETTLKEKYGVTMQDTFIQVDGEGNAVAKWNSGGEGVETLLANVQ